MFKLCWSNIILFIFNNKIVTKILCVTALPFNNNNNYDSVLYVVINILIIYHLSIINCTFELCLLFKLDIQHNILTLLVHVM